MAVMNPGAPSGLIHARCEVTQECGTAGLVWRYKDESNYLLLEITTQQSSVAQIVNGVREVLATDSGQFFSLGEEHSVQVLDGFGKISCYLDGRQLFADWLDDCALEARAGTGVVLGRGARIWDFEAHPHEIPMPASFHFEVPWRRNGEAIEIDDRFGGAPGNLAGREPPKGTGWWERILGSGHIELGGSGAAQVQASVLSPNPGRTFYTLPWRHTDFADVETTIVPPGSGRGEKQQCRAGVVFWQDEDNYITISAYLDDNYDGASIAMFSKRHGFEELYDAIWTMVGNKVFWGTPFRLRVPFDGDRFVIFLDDEPVMESALTDLYPEDPPLRILRVGIATNWEWGDDTGSRFRTFTARR
jgi:hypothetical protein